MKLLDVLKGSDVLTPEEQAVDEWRARIMFAETPEELQQILKDRPGSVQAALQIHAFGDTPGHAFHGNQHVKVGAESTGNRSLVVDQGPRIDIPQPIEDDIEGYTTDLMLSDRLIDFVKTGPQTAPPLYRGIFVDPGVRKELLDAFKPGLPVEMPLSSWSSSKAMGGAFSSEGTVTSYVFEQSEGVGLMFEAPSGARGLNIQPYSLYSEEKEWLMTGKFTVESVKTENVVDTVGQSHTTPVVHLALA